MYWGAVRDDEVLDPVLGGTQGESRNREHWAIPKESSKLVGRSGQVDDVVELVLSRDILEDTTDHEEVLVANEPFVVEVHYKAVGPKEIPSDD